MVNSEITAFLQERIDANDFPSAVYLVAEKGEIRFQDAIGNAVAEPERIPAQLDTIYDLASLTKVLVTGLVLAQLVEKGQMTLDGPVSGLSKEFGNLIPQQVTIRHLVSHTSGLPGWKPLYIGDNDAPFLGGSRSPEEMARNIVSSFAEELGKKVVYSDLGFVLLTHFLNVATGRYLHSVFKTEVSDQLGLTDTHYSPHPSSKRRIAANEKGNEFEKQTCIEQGYDISLDHFPWTYFRDEIIWGEVHDGNACFMGGVSGHAGLFATAGDVFKIAQQFLPRFTRLLKPETCELFTTNFTPEMNEHRSFAFQLASTPESTAGTLMSPQSFGHLGFTGTSLWIDPVKERIFILLTNRTHNHPLPFTNINSVRRRFHDLAITALDSK